MLDVANLSLLTEKQISETVYKNIALRAVTTKRLSVLREGNTVQGAPAAR